MSPLLLTPINKPVLINESVPVLWDDDSYTALLSAI